MKDFATNFSPEMILKINETLEFILRSPLCDFYRKKYGENPIFYPIKSYEDFKKIPFLTKEEFASLPLKKRLYVHESEIVRYSFSSGTSSSGAKMPTIMATSNDQMKLSTTRNEQELTSIGVKNIMLLMSPLAGSFQKSMKNVSRNLTMIPGDIKRLELMAKIAKEVGIQGINSTPTIIGLFIPYLEKEGFDFTQVKILFLGGEFCSVQKYLFLKEVFSNAKFDFRYGNSLLGSEGRGYRCEHFPFEGPGIFHPGPIEETVFEIIDEKKVLALEETGEMTVTSLANKAFPLFRLKTSDFGSISKKPCACGNEFFLKIGGRMDLDRIRFGGISLTTERLEEALETIREFVDPFFQAHIYENKIGNSVLPKIEFVLKPRNAFLDKIEDSFFLEKISYSIGAKLRFSPSSSYRDLVEKGIFLPLKITFVKKWPEESTKTRHIISHLDEKI